MKTSNKSFTVKSYLALLFISSFVVSFQSFSGNWTTENNLSGMDTVHIYLPSTPPKINNKRALMINLHGCLMSNTDMKKHAGWVDTADLFGMVVAIPDVPGKGAFSMACWDYYGKEHTRKNKHNDEIIKLALELTSRANLNIDPKQVYITGFSSGGGQANVIACLAPDIFSGVGSLAGPGLGTTASEFKKVPSNYSADNQAALCKKMAGTKAINLNSQIYSTIHGAADPIVSSDFNEYAANIMANVYNSLNVSKVKTIDTDGVLSIYSDEQGPRISKITINNMEHKWASNGANLGYFTNTKVDYPKYITQWFFDNNRRINMIGKKNN
ncbi:extracellular catalytic domain type 1 short-chain-length polyhydroxyalkanoate depolymerase [Thalassotalea profundi]|uniref:Esterase n=1 Tax=Thalassotalea profundi TaxID=2036687 RepID=A0ABQ3IGH8_9GAMM|nr:PHB depolymerase family esterase [Thalassotalea profundi]GHE82438.1 hypothetical protein GCM10011501_08320 [Thalassotalea profundi]